MANVPTIPSPLTGEQVLLHLEEVLSSPSFTSSKRSQEFLRYVVRETLEGRADLIKERTIASEVFGKGSGFESGEDSLVRVKAREVRKRLTDYYKSFPATSIQIEMPVGSYMPRIQAVAKPDPMATTTLDSPPSTAIDQVPIEKKAFDRRKLLWWLGGAVAAGGAVSTWLLPHHKDSLLERFWRPIFATKEPLIIFVPILLKEDGTLSDRVGIGPTAAVSLAASYLTSLHYPYRLRFGADLTFSQLRQQPSLLLGGEFSSSWTAEMMHGLRFHFVENESGGEIVDTQSSQKWSSSGVRSKGYTGEDYGVVCRLLDSNSSGQVVLMAAGITTFATESAAEFLFDPNLFSQLIEKAPKDWEKKNFEAVIHTSVIGSTPGRPDIVAVHFW